ncbi:MAG: S8 family serine peptidase [Verrucomicrobia bacterium]|nr:S8 family serine peptidase [Verrucomicrobiota bacterium]
MPTTATFVNAANPALAYQFLNGTSMATPHVTAAAALAGWNFPSETMAQRISRILSHTTAVPALSGKMTTGGRLDLLKMTDTDSDSLPDWWEMENFNSLAESAAGDVDGDGFSNLTEYLSNTKPVSASSFLSFTSFHQVNDTSGRSFVLTFPSVAERKYQIEWSDNLAATSWTLLGATITGTGAAIQITDPNALSTSPRRFYRLHVLND